MQGRRLSEGLHQAIEAKEGVKIMPENQTLASVTIQNYFRLYDKLSGMTGTAATEASEFHDIYKMDVLEVPTNRPIQRIDHDDEVYRTSAEKFLAVAKTIADRHAAGQPILVGTVSIEKSEKLSELLQTYAWEAEVWRLKPESLEKATQLAGGRRIKPIWTRSELETDPTGAKLMEKLGVDAFTVEVKSGKGVPHNVLNARHHEQEAFIVADAGLPGAVTIATNMAGRGTDIQLGGNLDMRLMRWTQEQRAMGNEITPEAEQAESERLKADIERNKQAALEAGGLFVLGTERHESRRIDNQLRGRTGRQGDPAPRNSIWPPTTTCCASLRGTAWPPSWRPSRWPRARPSATPG